MTLVDAINRQRSRCWLVIGLVAVIALGLASRKFPAMLPAFLGKHPGDALWALMVFLGLAFCQPRAATRNIAALAFTLSCLVEFSQLYQTAWLNEIRGTVLGHLVLGSTFTWFDIAAYAVGIVIGAMIDAVNLERQAIYARSRLRRLSPPGHRSERCHARTSLARACIFLGWHHCHCRGDVDHRQRCAAGQN
jgi:hypothetical protein